MLRTFESLKKSSERTGIFILAWNGTSFLEYGLMVVMAWAFCNYVLNFWPRTMDKISEEKEKKSQNLYTIKKCIKRPLVLDSFFLTVYYLAWYKKSKLMGSECLFCSWLTFTLYWTLLFFSFFALSMKYT